MTRSSKKSAQNGTTGLHERPQTEFRRSDDVSSIDYTPFQSLISTAILAATAFRLRDQDGLTEALRRLVRAVRPFEAGQAKD